MDGLSYAPMSRNDVIIGIAALVLVVFSLVVSIVIPRRDPGFPGGSIGVFVAVAASLVVLTLASVEIFGESHSRLRARRRATRARRARPQAVARPAARRRPGRRGRRQGDLRRRLRQLPHARGGRHERDRRPEPRRRLGGLRRRRPAGHERRRGHAGLPGHALRAADPGRRGVRRRLGGLAGNRGRRRLRPSRQLAAAHGRAQVSCALLLRRRRGRDLNPRPSFQRVRDFQSRSLGHSDTSPRPAHRSARRFRARRPGARGESDPT